MARLLALTIAALTGATDATLRVTGTYDPASGAFAGPPSRRPAEARRKLVADDIQGVIKTLRSDEIDDIVSLSRRRELSNAADQLDAHTRNYVTHGRRHADTVFESLNDVIGGLVGVLKDMNDEAKAAESPQPIAPMCVAPVSTSGLSDVAATMARLEQRLNKTAAEVADLIRHVEESKSRP